MPDCLLAGSGVGDVLESAGWKPYHEMVETRGDPVAGLAMFEELFDEVELMLVPRDLGDEILVRRRGRFEEAQSLADWRE